MFNIDNIPAGARYVMEKLMAKGYEAYLVGGCVRDMFMGATPKDWDICTNALPEAVQALFEDSNTVVPTGIKHGTVTIMIGGEGFEVTTYRIDGEYSDGRRPDTIEYTTNLTEDLSRRDFTVNAIAYNPVVGVVDPFGGVSDIRLGVLRCVGVPEDRFKEDSLRILRALRFVSTYGFMLEQNTSAAISSMYKQMTVLSVERIKSELSKLLMGYCVYRVLWNYPMIFTFLMPELEKMLTCEQNNPHHMFDVWEHTCRVVERVPSDEALRFAALLHDSGKPECKTTENGIDHFKGHPMVSAKKVVAILTRLKASNELIEKVTTLVLHHDAELPNKASVKRMLNKIGADNLRALLRLKEADTWAQAPEMRAEKIEHIKQVEQFLSEIEAENACFTLKNLAVNGDDLMSIGIPQGKLLGLILNQLLTGVMDEVFPNDKAVLLEQAVKISKQQRL